MPESPGRHALRVSVSREQVQRQPVQAQRVPAVPRELRRGLQRSGQHNRSKRMPVLSQSRSQRRRFGGEYPPIRRLFSLRLAADRLSVTRTVL